MSQNDTPPLHPGHDGREPGDALLKRYHEASALDPARPSPALREAVLAQARAAVAGQATTTIEASEAPQAATNGEIDPESIAVNDPPTLGMARKSLKPVAWTPKTARMAANDTSWRIRAVASVAVLGLATLLFLQFERGAPEERDLALGGPTATTAPGTSVQAPGLSGESGSAATSAPATAKGSADASRPLPQLAPGNAGPPPPSSAGAPAVEQGAARDHPMPATTPAPTQIPRDKQATAAPVDPKVTPADSARRERAAAEPEPAIGQTRSAPVLPAISGSRDAGAPASDSPVADSAARPATQKLEARARAPQSAVGRSAEADEALQSGPAASASQRLWAAAGTGALVAARQALTDGAPVNAADASGQTALMLAARRGDEAMVKLLLAAGADRTRTDAAGLSAAQHAGLAGQAALLPLLNPPESAQPALTQPHLTQPNPGTFPSSEKN